MQDEVESTEERGKGVLQVSIQQRIEFYPRPARPHHPDQRALHDLTRWRCSVRHAGDVRDDEHVEAVAVGMMRQ